MRIMDTVMAMWATMGMQMGLATLETVGGKSVMKMKAKVTLGIVTGQLSRASGVDPWKFQVSSSEWMTTCAAL